MTGDGTAPRRRGLLVLSCAALAVWLAVSVPLAAGRRTFYFRDVFSLHLPLKAFGAAELARGRIPALNPAWGLGQPFRGNPQALAFYPGNLLYLVLPFWSAFNLHYALHWLLAFLAMAALARELEFGNAGALAAGLTYAGSGWTLSALGFYHIVTVTAWWPLALWGAARGGRRGIALGGAACGMALLGGEPLLVALGLVPLAAVALSRRERSVPGAGARRLGAAARALIPAAGIVVLGLLIALPQLVASLRALPFTFRGAHGVPANQVGLYALAPLRLLELLVPLPFGFPAELGGLRFWGGRAVPDLPLVLSLHFGVVGLALALLAVRRRPGWALLAGAGLAAAWAGGVWGGGLAALSFGLFRFPEKALFWPALAVPLLAGAGLEVALADPRRHARSALRGAIVILLLLVAAMAAARPLTLAVARAGAPPEVVAAHTALWAAQLVALALLLALAAWAVRSGSAQGLLAVQLAAVLQLAPLVMTDSTAPYREPGPWTRRLGPGTRVVCGTLASPFLDSPPVYRLAEERFSGQLRIAALDLDATPGVLHGLVYPLAPDVDGFATPYFTLMLYNLPFLDDPARASWLRALGVEAATFAGDPRVPGLERIAAADRAGVPTGLYRVRGGAPAAWWPERLVPAGSPVAAFNAVSRAADPIARIAVPGRFRHDPRGRARLLEASPDRLVLETDGGGGIAVVRRAYQPLLEARSAAGGAETLPVNLGLLGVAVPPGPQRITLEVSSHPEILAGLVALLTLAATLAIGLARSRR